MSKPMKTTAKRGTRTLRYGERLSEDGKIVKDRAQQTIIKEIVAWASRGLSLAMIAQDLNNRGVKTQRGGEWRGNTIRSILDNNAPAPTPDEQPPNAPEFVPPPLFPDQEQIDRDDGFWHHDIIFDRETGKEKPTQRWISKTAHKAMQVEIEKVRQMTVAEQAENFHFSDLMHVGLGRSYHLGDPDPSPLVKELTRQTGRDVHKLLDELKGDPAHKRLLREAVKFLLSEIAIQRHINLFLREKLIAAETHT